MERWRRAVAKLSSAKAPVRLVLHWIAESPWRVTVAALLVSWIIIRPWGNYALNDDWTYAHMARKLAATGKVSIDVPIAPNGIGQALLGALAVRLFGFSHTVLRVLTMGVGCLGLWGVDRLLVHMETRKSYRLMGLLLLAFNPIYFYSATSFMNELHGYVPAILAAVIWFRGRRKAEPDRLISVGYAVVAGALAGGVFWTRQTSVLVYPALLAGTLAQSLLAKRLRPILKSLPALAASAAAFALIIRLFFSWARATGNLRPEFAVRIENLWKVDTLTYQMQAGSAFVYMTAFFLPLLLLVRWRARYRWPIDLLAVALVMAGLVTRYLFETHAPSDFWIGPIWSHKTFPFVVNIVYNAGLGPITLDDTFFFDVAKPSWPKWAWTSIESVLIFAGALWSPFAAGALRGVRSKAPQTSEGLLFSAALVFGSLIAIIQTHQGEMVDRYYLPLIIGLSILVPGALSVSSADPDPYGYLKFALAGGAIALFTVLGAHDEFRWNDARWKMIDLAMQKGGTRATVQGGYELNCWNRYEGLAPEELACEGGCRCLWNGFCCVDDRWRVGMSVHQGYESVASEKPAYWLADGPAVLLSHRRPP